MSHKIGETIDRFMAKVEKTDTCWLWRGATNGGNSKNLKYGFFAVYPKMVYTHRFMWEYQHGPIPPKMCVCHTCDNPLCVNPDHLFLGTQAENIQDRDAKGRNILKGRPVSGETREKMSASQKGRKHTQEQNERQSRFVKAWWASRKSEKV
jgi:hypothetical protein